VLSENTSRTKLTLLSHPTYFCKKSDGYQSSEAGETFLEIKKPDRHYSWQPGYLDKIRGFPSLSFGRFGLFWR